MVNLKKCVSVVVLLIFGFTNSIAAFASRNNDGNIALCFEDSARKKIVIYDLNGDFKYGYSFMESGSIGVEWDENNIIIYSVRGDRAVWVDKAANMIDM